MCFLPNNMQSAPQGWIYTDNSMCCHTDTKGADQSWYPTKSQYTDTGTVLSPTFLPQSYSILILDLSYHRPLPHKVTVYWYRTCPITDLYPTKLQYTDTGPVLWTDLCPTKLQYTDTGPVLSLTFIPQVTVCWFRTCPITDLYPTKLQYTDTGPVLSLTFIPQVTVCWYRTCPITDLYPTKLQYIDTGPVLSPTLHARHLAG